MINEQHETIIYNKQYTKKRSYVCAECCTTLLDSRPRIGLVAKTDIYVISHRTKIK